MKNRKKILPKDISCILRSQIIERNKQAFYYLSRGKMQILHLFSSHCGRPIHKKMQVHLAELVLSWSGSTEGSYCLFPASFNTAILTTCFLREVSLSARSGESQCVPIPAETITSLQSVLGFPRRPAGGNSFRPLASAILFFWSLWRAHDCR